MWRHFSIHYAITGLNIINNNYYCLLYEGLIYIVVCLIEVPLYNVILLFFLAWVSCVAGCNLKEQTVKLTNFTMKTCLQGYNVNRGLEPET